MRIPSVRTSLSLTVPLLLLACATQAPRGAPGGRGGVGPAGRGARVADGQHGRGARGARGGDFIVTAPMGCNERGWYGEYESDCSTPQQLREYSEKDVINVLAFMLAEFDVDEGGEPAPCQSHEGARDDT